MQQFSHTDHDNFFLKPPAPQNWRSPNWPELSVSIITYNQVQLVGRAIESVLRQRVNFTFEIIIGDDCSSDGTTAVLKTYQQRYPELITLILHPRRRSELAPGRINSITNIYACRGKYTAHLDGDDFWTDPDKLQRQYDLLERHPGISLCCHNSYITTSVDSITHQNDLADLPRLLPSYRYPTGRYSQAYIGDHNAPIAQMSTIMCRTRVWGDHLPEYYYHVAAADFLYYLLVSERGDVYYEAEPAGAYFFNPATISRSVFRTRPLLTRLIRDKEMYIKTFPALATGRFSRQRAHYNLLLVKCDFREGRHRQSLTELAVMVRRYPRYSLKIAAIFTLRHFRMLPFALSMKRWWLRNASRRHKTGARAGYLFPVQPPQQ